MKILDTSAEFHSAFVIYNYIKLKQIRKGVNNMWSSRQFDYQDSVVRFLNLNKETITDVSICNNGGNLANNAYVVFFKVCEGCVVYEINN